MHLRYVEIFCDTVAFRSFSKAAEARGMSQPAVSQAIQQIEESLGVTLIDRSQRPLELTPAGRIYHDGCRRLLDEYREIEDRVRQFNGRVAGRVRVASIYSVGLLQMSAYVREFARVLKPAGVGVVQHGAVGGARGGWRSDVTAGDVQELLRSAGLQVRAQIDSWRDSGREFKAGLYDDVVTIFEKPSRSQPA